MCFEHPEAVSEMQKKIVYILDVIQRYAVRHLLDGVFFSLYMMVIKPQ